MNKSFILVISIFSSLLLIVIKSDDDGNNENSNLCDLVNFTGDEKEKLKTCHSKSNGLKNPGTMCCLKKGSCEIENKEDTTQICPNKTDVIENNCGFAGVHGPTDPGQCYKIELTSDYLIMSINKKTNHNNEIKSFVKNLKSEIDNEHKLEKAKLQLMLDLKKINSLEEKIEKRYNKIYFLTKRRKNLKECKIKKQIKIANLKINKNDNIQDFLYNEESSKEQ